MAKVNRENVADHLVDYQLGIIGKSMQEAYMTKEWYSKWTMTTEQHEAFKTYASSKKLVLPDPVRPPINVYIDFLMPIYLFNLSKPIGIPLFLPSRPA